MDMNRALEILGPICNQEDVENISAALTLFKSLNTPQENEKLMAAQYALKHWKTFSYQAKIVASQQKQKGVA
jgi:hypothetical protein